MEEVNVKINLQGGNVKKTVGDVRKELEQTTKAGDKTAESVAKIGNEGLSVKQRLKQLKDEMANIGNIGSPRFQELAAEAGKLKDQMNNANAAIKTMSSDFGKLQVGIEAFTAIGSAAQFAAGAQLLLGEENKEVAKALQRVVALTTMMSAVQQIANLTSDEGALGIAIRTTKMKLLNKATLEQAAATGTATTAQKLFNFILNKNPIAAIITAVIALIGGLVALAKNVESVGRAFQWLEEVATRAINAAINGLSNWNEELDKTALKEMALAKSRENQHNERTKALADEIRQIKKEQKAFQEAQDETIRALEVEKSHQEALGKSSDEVTVKILEAQLAKVQATYDAASQMINSWIDYYKREAELAGLSEEEYKESMKKRGIDLDELQEKADKLLLKNEQDVQLAEDRITKFKREQHEKRSAEAQKQRDKEIEEEKKRLDEIEKLAQKEYDLRVKAADDLFNRRVSASEKLHELEVKRSGDEIAMLELEYQKKIEKLDSSIQEENELILFYEQELREKKQELYDEWDEQDREREEQKLEEENQRREENIDRAEQAAESIFTIWDSSQSLLHGKELKRAHEKMKSGEKLTKHEEKLIRREEALKKAQALAQITSDTARGVSGAIAAGAGVPFPGNLLAIASGVASVLAGMAQASQVLGESAGIPSISESTSPSTQQEVGNQTPNVGTIQSGSTLLNQEQRVYVVESDITNTQDKVKAIVNQATY